MQRTVWILRVIMWDGLLPVLIAGSPTMLRWTFPGNDEVVFLAAGLFPFAAALLRCTLAEWQLSQLFPARIPWLRQVIIAGAIVLLLLFEVSVNVLTAVLDEPLAAWTVPLAFYAVYLLLICYALRPSGSAREANLPDDSGAGMQATRGAAAWQTDSD